MWLSECKLLFSTFRKTAVWAATIVNIFEMFQIVLANPAAGVFLRGDGESL